MAYRQTRNCESSTIERIQAILTANSYTNVSVEKVFARVYDIPLDSKEGNAVICVRVSDTTHSHVEAGSHLTSRHPLIIIDVFATNDGQKLDLKDLLITNLKSGYTYNEFVIVNGIVDSRTANGRIEITEFDDTPVSLDIDKSILDIHDRYRHRITLHARLSALES